MRGLALVMILYFNVAALAAPATAPAALADLPSIADQPANTWVKRSPLPEGPMSPRLGDQFELGLRPPVQEADPLGGHVAGGGGPQLSETWTYDVLAGKWDLMTPNNNPPGNCCCRENAMDPTSNKFYRFSYPSFGHGWMWTRSRFLREDSVWTYDLSTNRWTNMCRARSRN